jgi:hypothetical protein
MPSPFDVEQVVDDIIATLNGMLKKDIAAIQGFERQQLRLLAVRAQRIATRWARGEIDDQRAAELSADLERDAKTLADALVLLTALEVEKVWNAIVNAVWGAINGAITGAIDKVLPVPKLPAPGGG